MSSAPSPSETRAPETPPRLSLRRSALWRLSAVYFFAFVVVAVVFTAAAVQLVRAKNAERVQALVAADLEAVLDKIGEGPDELTVGKATAIVLARSAQAGEGRLYRLEEGGRAIAGNLPAGATLRPRGTDWLSIESPPGLALQRHLGPGAVLTVGRGFGDSDLEAELARVALGSLGLAAICAFLVGPWASRRIVRQVEAVNAVCRKVEAGDLSARAAGADAPDEFGALARHVNSMLGRIDDLVTGLSDVSNRVAHDLRTPMARLKNDLQAAAGATTLEEARAMAGVAAAEADEILESFEALLDIAEVEAGSSGRLSPVRLDEAAAAAVELYEAVAEDRSVRLGFERAAGPVLGERSLLVRLIANLLDNAIKFSPEGGTVTVRITPKGGEVLLFVEDEGPGVPAEERERVLRRFARGTHADVIPGHGLGLALVVAVARRHGARLSMENMDRGLRVCVAFRRFDETPAG